MQYKKMFLALVMALMVTFTVGVVTVSAYDKYSNGTDGSGRDSNCRWHYIRRGETLSEIGRLYGMSWRIIAGYDNLHNPNYILAGQYLCVPRVQRSNYPPAQTYQNPKSTAPYNKQPSQSPMPMATSPMTTTQAMTVTVQVRNFEFAPKTVMIHAGATVVWQRTQGDHSVHADDSSFGNQPSATWSTFSHTFTRPGTYRYYCQIHGGPNGTGMAGVVIVR